MGGQKGVEEKEQKKVEKQAEIEKTQEELEELQNKQPHEFYNHYDFDNEVRFFTDFMQS